MHINHKVAQFGRCAVAAGQQLAIQHYAAADTGAQRDHDHAAAPFACTRAVLAPGGNVGVVIHIDGQAGALVDHLAQRDVVKFQIVGIQHGAGVHIDAAGRTDAHPGGITQGQTQGNRHAAAEQRDTVGDVRRRAGQPGLDAVGQQQFPVQVGNAACDVGAAQIDPDTITHNLPRFFTLFQFLRRLAEFRKQHKHDEKCQHGQREDPDADGIARHIHQLAQTDVEQDIRQRRDA